jgi:hypothetical protein
VGLVGGRGGIGQEKAAEALKLLATQSAENKAAIVAEGGIVALVGLARGGIGDAKAGPQGAASGPGAWGVVHGLKGPEHALRTLRLLAKESETYQCAVRLYAVAAHTPLLNTLNAQPHTPSVNNGTLLYLPPPSPLLDMRRRYTVYGFLKTPSHTTLAVPPTDGVRRPYTV